MKSANGDQGQILLVTAMNRPLRGFIYVLLNLRLIVQLIPHVG
jgi:hypothetical protein